MAVPDINLKNFYNTIIKQKSLFYGHQFIIEFNGNDLPDGLLEKASLLGVRDTSISYHVQSSSIPQVDIKENEVSFLSQKFVVPGNVTFGDSWRVKIFLDNDIKHYKLLYLWQQSFADLGANGAANTVNGFPGKKAIPNVRAKVTLLNNTMTAAKNTFILEGVYPTEIPNLPMKYENSSNIVMLDCTFVYQYMWYAELEGEDPLKANNS